MIRNNDVRLILELFNQLNRGNPAVNGNDQVRPFFDQFLQRFPVEAVALGLTFGNIKDRVAAEIGQNLIHERCRRYAVNIVVTVNNDLFPFCQRVKDTRHGLLRAGKEKRVGQAFHSIIKKTVSRGGIGNSAVYHSRGKDSAYMQFLTENPYRFGGSLVI